MITDNGKKDIVGSIMKAFDKWGSLYYQNLFTELNNGNPDAYKIAFSEQGFLERRAIDIGAYMYTLGKCNDSKIISKHRPDLIKAAIISIIKGGFTLSELESKNSDQNTKYTRRHKQRFIHDYYKESIFEIDSEKGNDKRFNVFSSVFSTNNPPKNSVENIAAKYQKSDYELATSNRTIMDRLSFNSVLRFAFPEFLDDLLKFKEECKEVFENLGDSNDRISFLRDELAEFTPTLQTFYSHLTSILALSWFHFNSKKAQKSFFELDFKLKYSKSDAEKAKNMILSNTKDRKYTGFLLSHCANAFISYGKYQEAISLFEQCNDLTENELEKGITWQNIAVAYRSNKNFKLMLQAMKKALTYYKKSKSIYQICMALQLIGESRWQLGLKESAMKSFQEAEDTSKLMNQDETYKILINIGMSFNRLGEKGLRNKYWTRALPLIPEKETERILKLNDMLNSR
ncbi:hypothetical protein YTPLAS73_07530 [Nitrosarchaeum sp.]|nr:hypothetical protein YTPLAS73_07530 [Nitrosarchaeum sp.]